MAVTDLVIDSITAPLTVEKNATLNFSYVVKNVGTISTSRAFGTSTALDHTPAYPDDAGGAVFGLSAGATKTLSYSYSTAGLSVGEHTLWVLADDTNVVTEGDETNNLASVTFTIVNTKPDLTVTSLATDQPFIVEGNDLSFSYVVQNLGGTASSSGSILYDIDRQPSISHHTGPIGGAFVEAGGSMSISESISTSGLSVGQHTLWVSVDATNSRSENDETNNLASITFTVTAAPKPDQIIESITGPSTVVQGGDLNFSYVLKDIAVDNTADSFGVITFGVDRQPTSSSYDYSVGAGTLPAGGSLTFNEVLHANLSVGEHTLWIKADGLGNVTESNEANNLRSFTFTVTEAPKPDLSITAAGVTVLTVVERGSDLSVEYLLKNLGPGDAPASAVGFMFDQQADATHYVATSVADALTAGGTYSSTALLDTTALSVGDHTLWVVADVLGGVTEVSEANNATAVTIHVTEATRPDLVVSSITLPPSIAWTDEIEISFVVKNTGLVAANASTLNYQFGSTFVPDAGNFLDVGPLAAGASQTVTVTVDTLGLIPGAYTLWAKADSSGILNETHEANNLSSTAFTVGGAGAKPDLLVAPGTLHADALVSADSFLSFSYQLLNNGSAAAGTTATIYAIDHKPAWGSAPYTVASALDAGAYGSYSGNISTAGLSLGTHTLWIGVDGSNTQAERSEVNNWTPVTFEVTNYPDLVISDQSASSYSVTQGFAFSFSYRLQSILPGTAASATTVLYGIDQKPDATHFVASKAVGGLSGVDVFSLSDSIATAGLSIGQHTLWIAADGSNVQPEVNETNNYKAIVFNVTAPPRPDLVVTDVTSGITVEQGGAFDVSYIVRNIGALASADNWAALRIDQQPTPTSYAAVHAVGAMGSNGLQSLSSHIDTSGLSVGQHTLWISADYSGLVSEADETNNATSVTFTVTASKADLVVSNLALWNGSVTQGQNLGFNYTVTNDGAASSNAGYHAFYIDVLDGAHYRGNNFTDAVGAGASRALFNAFNTGDLSVGQHTLWVGADNFGHTAESNENNNYRSITFNVTAPPQAVASVSMSAGGDNVSMIDVASSSLIEWTTIL